MGVSFGWFMQSGKGPRGACDLETEYIVWRGKTSSVTRLSVKSPFKKEVNMSISVDLRTRPAWLDRLPKQLLIDGQWVSARSGKTFDAINPSTGEVLTQVAEGEAADIDAAVVAARRAFEGPWRRFTPVQRQNVLLKLAELVEENYAEMRLIEVLTWDRRLGWGGCRRCLSSNFVTTLVGRRKSMARPCQFDRSVDIFLYAQGAGRRMRLDYPLERPAGFLDR